MSAIAVITAIVMGFCGLAPGTSDVQNETVDFEVMTMLVFEPDVEDLSSVTEQQMDSAISMVRLKLDKLGCYDAVITKSGDMRICVNFPYVIEDTSEIKSLICKREELNFRDVDGNVVMEGTDKFIKSASAEYGLATSYVEKEHYILINFTNEGRAAFKTATENALARSAEGGDYIAITFGDELIANPKVGMAIDSESCIITGGFTKESAEEFAKEINLSLISFNLKSVDF